MIVVENWSGFSSSFTLELGPPPGAQTGPPNPTINPVGPFCVSAPSVQLTAVNNGGDWTGPGVSLTGLFNPATAGVGTHTINYSIGNPPCQANSSTTITVHNGPTTVAGSNSPVCAGSPLNLTATGIAGTTFSWTGPNGFTSGAQNPSIASPTIAASGTYTVIPTQGGCAGPPATVNVTVNPIPVVLPGNNGPVCAGQPLNLTVNATAGATYSWTGPNGFISGVQNPSIASPTTAATGTYTVVVTANGCSATATTNVVVNNCCLINNFTANISAPTCGPSSGTYGITGLVIFTSPPSTGTLTVTSSCGGTQVFNAPFVSPINYSLTAIPANGASE
jgi:hypothetical protein